MYSNSSVGSPGRQTVEEETDIFSDLSDDEFRLGSLEMNALSLDEISYNRDPAAINRAVTSGSGMAMSRHRFAQAEGKHFTSSASGGEKKLVEVRPARGKGSSRKVRGQRRAADYAKSSSSSPVIETQSNGSSTLRAKAAAYVPANGPLQPKAAPFVPAQYTSQSKEALFVPSQGSLQPKAAPFVPAQYTSQSKEALFVPSQGSLQPKAAPFIPAQYTSQSKEAMFMPSQGSLQPKAAPFIPAQYSSQSKEALFVANHSGHQPPASPFLPNQYTSQSRESIYSPQQQSWINS